MSFDIRTRDDTWTLDATWVDFDRKPSAQALRRHARTVGATHYGIVATKPWQVGFFDLPKSERARKSLKPLAPAVAASLGAGIYAAIEIEPGRHWILVTGSAGRLLPNSDRVISTTDRESFRKRLPAGVELEERTIGYDELDALLAGLSAPSVPLHAVSLRQTLRLIGIGVGTAAVLMGGYSYWQAREAAIAEQKRRLALQMEAARRAAHAHATPEITPTAWVEGCLRAARAQPLFQGGWALTRWSCTDGQLSLSWSRAGGTVAEAPGGNTDPVGEHAQQTLPITYDRTRPRQPTHGNGLVQLIAMLQQLGVAPQVTPGAVVAGSPPAPTSVSWQFPITPDTDRWDRIPGLRFVELDHTTGLTVPGNGVSALTSSYAMMAVVASSQQPGVTP